MCGLLSLSGVEVKSLYLLADEALTLLPHVGSGETHVSRVVVRAVAV